MKACTGSYFTTVFVEKKSDKVRHVIARLLTTLQLVAVGTVFVERKFTRGLGVVGHIEDIAVSKTMQGRKLGLYLIKSLEEIARTQGCYKVILDCSTANIRGSDLKREGTETLTPSAFYEKCGYVASSNMSAATDGPASRTRRRRWSCTWLIRLPPPRSTLAFRITTNRTISCSSA